LAIGVDEALRQVGKIVKRRRLWAALFSFSYSRRRLARFRFNFFEKNEEKLEILAA
jgi:hypothetical protein